MSKAIYKPKGKAGEYAEWACNLYVGCSNNCSYCYCKKGLLSHAMGGPVAKLKSCFKDEEHAYEVFKKELHENLDELRKSSLFFTFSSDPMIPETRELNGRCIRYAITKGVRCQVLTKNADFIHEPVVNLLCIEGKKDMIAFGFTITGRDPRLGLRP
jgi:DNA repair photolyase